MGFDVTQWRPGPARVAIVSDWWMVGDSLLPGEVWWGGAVADGRLMPFGPVAHQRDLGASAGMVESPTVGANQSAPLLVSSAGRFLWSERPFTFSFDGNGAFGATGGAELVLGSADEPSLRAAFRKASAEHFPASGRAPAAAMFTGPQWNTWIELPYEPTQHSVLDYARGVVEAGFPPGVLMIDDRWSYDYGNWTFDAIRFPDPAAMTAELHALGFAVMLWLVPFVSPDSAVSRMLASRGQLITGRDGRPVVREWWNGWSTMLDLGSPGAVDWLRGELLTLQAEAGVDGFKFDAGDVRDWHAGDVSASAVAAVDYCEDWARLAVEFDLNELRACWKMGGQPLAQRLHDKPPVWGRAGLASLIPEGIAQGLIGHAFNCPDMIGGGDLEMFAEGAALDQELFVRFAQCSALFPMMQFSLAPWRVLDEAHLAAVRAAVELRQSLLPEILALVNAAAVTGEPIMRPLAYHFDGYTGVHDQFMLGAEILVAPVIEPGATTRQVLLPPGRWTAPDTSTIDGPTELEIAVGLDSSPFWRLSPV